MVCNEKLPFICFSLWSTFPCLWKKHLTCSWLVQTPVTSVPRFWGFVSQAHTADPEFIVLIQKKQDCSKNAEKGQLGYCSTQTRECCAEVLAAGYLNTVYMVRSGLELIDSLLTCFGFWLFTIFFKWNPQWTHLWVFYMSNFTSTVTMLEKDICGNCRVFHPGKSCGKHVELTKLCPVWSGILQFHRIIE